MREDNYLQSVFYDATHAFLRSQMVSLGEKDVNEM
jgi:hypothetical protein